MTSKRTGDWSTYARKLLSPTVEAGEAICPRCGQTVWPWQKWDVGHARDLATHPHQQHTRAAVRAGIRSRELRPEHRSCNRAAGAVLGNRLRARRPRAAKPQPAATVKPVPAPSRRW